MKNLTLVATDSHLLSAGAFVLSAVYKTTAAIPIGTLVFSHVPFSFVSEQTIQSNTRKKSSTRILLYAKVSFV